MTRGLFILLLFLALLPAARAQDAETRAFHAAAKAFQDGFMERAEKEFADFVVKHPASPRLLDAILLQARAAFKRQNFKGAVELLNTHLPQAGELADQYRYWLAEIYFENGQFQQAADAFALLLQEFPNSARRLEASYGEAQARFKLREWPRVTALLLKPDGDFQKISLTRTSNDELVVRGHLLLAEALLEQRNFAMAESTLMRLAERKLTAELNWRRQFLLCRVQLAGQRLPVALASTTNLVALAAGQAGWLAASYALQGQVLEGLNRFADAVAAYERNQAEGIPAERRREAFLKIIELTLAQGKIDEAAAKLGKYFTAQPGDAASDVALLTVGELRLQQHFAAPPATNGVAGTNFLQQALGYFDKLIKDFPHSPQLGKAKLQRGWCLLTDGKAAESQAAFQSAVELLPPSEAQAVARFKLGDLQFQQRDYTNALANYRRVLADYGWLPRVKKELSDRALYQILQASVAVGDLTGAGDAIQKILAAPGGSAYADRSVLLYGQGVAGLDDPAKARVVYTDFLARFPGSPLRPEVELAVARTFENEGSWPAALARYDGWVLRFPTNDSLPRAEFQRAYATSRAGQETNALVLFKNFIARFPAHPLAPRAQNWVGDYFYSAENSVEAERNYQLLFQNTNWLAGELQFQARFKAGRAALTRQSYANAIDYFTNLINHAQCPPALVAETFFIYGDTIIARPSAESAGPLVKFEEAIVIFSRIPQLFPNDPNTPRAWGRIADCHFQLGRQDPRRYTNALENYQKVVAAPLADVAARSQAVVGQGNVWKAQAQLAGTAAPALWQGALDQYLNVVYGSNLREGEKPDPFWVKEAALAAAKIAESQKKWERAIDLYRRLQQLVPPLRAGLEKRIDFAREQLGAEKN